MKRRQASTSSRRRGARGSAAEAEARSSTLAREWRVWIAENLARGGARSDIEATLAKNGVPPEEIRLRVDEILASPALDVARRAERERRKLEQILELVRAHRRLGGLEVPRAAGIDGETFFRRWYANHSPVILTDYVTRWPAFQRWSLAYFVEKMGDEEVRVAQGRASDPSYDRHTPELTVTMTMRALVEKIEATHESNDFYMVARNRNLEDPRFAWVFEDLLLDRGLFDRKKLIGSTQLWLGPRGTVTPLHHDTSNILLCQVRGEKKVRLASPLETSLLAGADGLYSAIDPERDALGALLSVVTLSPGEALFIPSGWWHHVRALSPSISVALNGFAHTNPGRDYCPGSLA